MKPDLYKRFRNMTAAEHREYEAAYYREQMAAWSRHRALKATQEVKIEKWWSGVWRE